MKLERIDIYDSIDHLEDLLNDEEIEIKKMLVYGEHNNRLLVFFKPKEEQLRHEEARLDQIQEVAHSVRADELYSELKNANQRYLYLLDKYHIPKSIALDVMDEVKVLEITEK